VVLFYFLLTTISKIPTVLKEDISIKKAAGFGNALP
jgi:hypothetical protein